MTPTENTLAPLLAEMFAAAGKAQAGVHRQLEGGLHVKVALRGERKQLIVWRTKGRLPGATECEILGHDAGLIQPKFRSWQVGPEGARLDAFLITDAFTGQLCTHTWSAAAAVEDAKTRGEEAHCSTCRATWRTATPKRGKKVRHHYNGAEVRPAVFERFLVRGPVPEGAVVKAPAVASPAPAAAAPLIGQVCGTCRHGRPDGCDVACTLGWAAHDGLWLDPPPWAPGKWEPAEMGHGGLPLPLLTPRTRCMATGDRWLPRTGEVEAA
ncbi:hypothetical protein GO986_08860 [Deinococcus sp. HMF7620]|uniref:Uncharacterized protein n=1 Tax=Deinococcus arboris TaxID=2682977 RepID=A0A7C9HRI7_9DEIO|nr:hypothetical protein [Deinococcus arboris]MVN86873.1 hypothetical protein [Deinococcus arboris]